VRALLSRRSIVAELASALLRPPHTTITARARIWARAVTTFDPPPALLADLDRVAPKPRRDALTESDW
jgi:hypothetical protein